MPTPTTQLSHVEITVLDVFEELNSLDPSKAFSCDDVSPYILKYCATSLATPITSLFTQCITTSSIPQEWKTHKICPVPKSSDHSLVSNYRPISLLCTLSKVLEAIVYKKIIPFIRPLISPNQFGFLKNSSAHVFFSYCLHLTKFIPVLMKKESVMLYFWTLKKHLTQCHTMNYYSSFGVKCALRATDPCFLSKDA